MPGWTLRTQPLAQGHLQPARAGGSRGGTWPGASAVRAQPRLCLASVHRRDGRKGCVCGHIPAARGRAAMCGCHGLPADQDLCGQPGATSVEQNESYSEGYRGQCGGRGPFSDRPEQARADLGPGGAKRPELQCHVMAGSLVGARACRRPTPEGQPTLSSRSPAAYPGLSFTTPSCLAPLTLRAAAALGSPCLPRHAFLHLFCPQASLGFLL